MNNWQSLIEESPTRAKETREMYETMYDCRKSATDSIGTMNYGRATDADRPGRRQPPCAICKCAVESLAFELFVIVCVVLLLALITVQLLLDIPVLSVYSPSAATYCSQSSNSSSSSATVNPYWVTAQIQYAITAFAAFFVIESVARMTTVRRHLCSQTNLLLVNVADTTTCMLFGGASVALTVLTYFRLLSPSASDAQFVLIRDAVNYLVAIRLVRLALVLCGATSRVRRELSNALALKRTECALLLDRAARLERRVAELESRASSAVPGTGTQTTALTYSKKGGPAERPAANGAPLTVVEVHSERERERERRRGTPTTLSKMALIRPEIANAPRYNNDAFEMDTDTEEEAERPKEADLSQAQIPTLDSNGLHSDALPSQLPQISEPVSSASGESAPRTEIESTDAELENGLTPEAEAVIQRLYELGLEWEGTSDLDEQIEPGDSTENDTQNQNQNQEANAKARKQSDVPVVPTTAL